MRTELRNETQHWYLHSGVSDGCLNIRVYSNGATDSDYETNPEYAEENIDEIHICDIDAMISDLKKARANRDAEPRA